MNDEDEQPLARIMAATAEAMKAELDSVRTSFDHPGMVGSSVEDIVARFLNERLPASVRAVAGQAVDSTGRRSKQLDVIVYDTARTPLLFTSARGTQNLVPVEGILSVVEVKTKLTREELRRSVENCDSVKQLQRIGFLPEVLQRKYKLYGSTWTVPPVYYSVFAFESDGLYAEALNDEIDQSLQLHEQVDTVVCLSRGLCLNVSVDVTGDRYNLTATPHFSATPTPETIRVNVETQNALVVWYAMLAATVMEKTPCPPIDVTHYLKSELHLTGTASGGAAIMALRDRVVDSVSETIDLDPVIGRKLVRRERFTPAELYELLRHPAQKFRDVAEDEALAESLPLLTLMKQTAGQQDQADWVARWFPGHHPHQPIDA